ncbi:alpha/beta hydrolase [Paracoccus xiamenensis]|uniref:alpha/beta hydrolase n=1 Tax=Paracoccus xiamenensis TaxID=2714901 RepID=UPI00140967C2|nr:alpha/beta hydrolase [Paracoccus xiamenensis]NHF74820.1 alpha/beta hydrolase [Paracoccus xiamenensis]
MPQRPTIVLVHGFWGGAAHWAGVIKELHKRGYHDLRAVENPLTSLADDAERTRKMVKQIHGPVVLVGHSYGGAVITEMGDLPNVQGLVYVAAFAPDAGESPGGISQAKPPEAFPNLAPDSDGYLWIKQDKFHESFCQDLPEDEALVMAVTQKAPLASTFGDNVTAPAWKAKPCWYQVSTHDRMIDPENQEMMSGRMNPKRVVHLAASHASLASHPEEIADLIDEAATETGY